MEKTHAQLKITLSRDITGDPKNAEVYCEISGCTGCLEISIASLLLRNEKFKALINSSVRMANEIKGKTQN